MFGESDSESPRVPSPWDSLTPPSSSPPKHHGIPKLVPEADEVGILSRLSPRLITWLSSQGNVEYKLQLLSPTPDRFARLVTQLKWRLLEGGGQAYYELGVADSGILVGLPRQQLEESLETLEMMASEIGASVIVVKEIEVPPELSGLAESQLERWDSKRSTRRKDMLRMMKQDESPTTSATEVETVLSNTDVTDIEETTSYSPATSPASLGEKSDLTQPRPSPNLSPFDPALAMFTMDVEEDVTDYADNEALDVHVPTDYLTELFVRLEITSVYKPRPMKKRAIHVTSPLSPTKKRLKNGYPPSKSTDTACGPGDSIAQDPDETHLKGAKAQLRRDKQDKGRELTHVPTRGSTESSTNPVDHHTVSSCTTDEPDVYALESPQAGDAPGTVMVISKEPRLIVEALVVWKLSLDEAFLDFEGFSLQ